MICIKVISTPSDRVLAQVANANQQNNGAEKDLSGYFSENQIQKNLSEEQGTTASGGKNLAKKTGKPEPGKFSQNENRKKLGQAKNFLNGFGNNSNFRGNSNFGTGFNGSNSNMLSPNNPSTIRGDFMHRPRTNPY